MAALRVLDLVTDKDVAAGVVPGLERAVAKSKGVEFGSLLHEFGADFSANPYSSAVREILLQIDPECESRLPKRRVDRAGRKPPNRRAEPEKPAKEAKEPPATDEAGRRPAAPTAKDRSDETGRRPPAESRRRAAKRNRPPRTRRSRRTAPPKKRPASESSRMRTPR